MSENSILSQMPLDVGDNLILRFGRPDDVDVLADFNSERFNNERQGQWTRELFQHPTLQPHDFTVVEDTETNKIVSSMFSLSQTWSYGGILLKVGMPELIATHPDYQRKGLVRKQFEVIHAKSAAKSELMQVIGGIPWFYTRFGYEKAINRFGGRVVNRRNIPKLSKRMTEKCRLRPSVETDHPFIAEVYDHAIRRHLFAVHRTPVEWHHTFYGHAEGSSRYHQWLIIESPNGEQLGYIHYGKTWDGILPLQQVELKPNIGYLNLMRGLVRELWREGERLGGEEGFHGIDFSLGIDHPLYDVLPENEVVDNSSSMLFVRVPDMTAFLKHIRPALERNLVGTVAEGYTEQLQINLYESGILMRFVDGVITEISQWSPQAVYHGDAFFPDSTFLQLVCGRRRFSKLAKEYPDCSAAVDEASVLLDCLFPPFKGHVWVMS